MNDILFSRETFVWLLLMSATALSWFMSAVPASDATASGSAIILPIAFFKVRLVVMHFMEAGHAPAVLRWASEAAIVLSCALVLTFYYYGEQLVALGFPVG